MMHKIIDQLLKEDTFEYFTERGIQKLANDTQNATNIKNKIQAFFIEIYNNNKNDTLIANECERMLFLLEKIINEIEDEEEKEKDDDCIINIYVENLKKFTENINDEDVKKHVNYVCN
ncbi:hypothetical protein BDAP_002723 [Binucleata daphniae]